MDTAAGIVTFGPGSFVEWVRSKLEQADMVEYLGGVESLERVTGKTSAKKPRALLIDLESIGDMSVGSIGTAAKRGYQWVAIVVICNQVTEDLLPLYSAILRRRWSIFSRPLVETIGIERMLAGAFTSTGMQDLGFRELQDAAHAKALEGVESDDDDEDAA